MLYSKRLEVSLKHRHARTVDFIFLKVQQHILSPSLYAQSKFFHYSKQCQRWFSEGNFRISESLALTVRTASNLPPTKSYLIQENETKSHKQEQINIVSVLMKGFRAAPKFQDGNMHRARLLQKVKSPRPISRQITSFSSRSFINDISHALVLIVINSLLSNNSSTGTISDFKQIVSIVFSCVMFVIAFCSQG